MRVSCDCHVPDQCGSHDSCGSHVTAMCLTSVAHMTYMRVSCDHHLPDQCGSHDQHDSHGVIVINWTQNPIVHNVIFHPPSPPQDSSGPFGSSNAQPELVYTSLSERAVKIASGSDHLVILTEQGNVYTLGCAEQGQLGRVAECFSSRGGRKGVSLLLEPDIVRVPRKRGTAVPKFTDVFCGSYHTYGCTSSPPTIYVWGLNNYGQLGTGDTVSKYQPHVIDVHKWFGEDCNGVGDLQIAGGQHHSVFCHNGSVYVVGRKEYGRLGLGKEVEDPHLPQKVPALTNVSSVAAGVACSFAVTSTGEAYSWGMGTNMQLGSGSDEDVWTPGRVKGKNLENCHVLAISAGGQHTAMLVRKE